MLLTTKPLRPLLAGLGCLALLAPTTSADELKHAELAQAWMTEHGVEPASVEPFLEALDTVVAKTFVEVDLGALRIFLPCGLDSDDPGIDRAALALTTLLDVQEVWASWATLGSGERKLPKDVGKARKQIDKWAKASLADSLVAAQPGTQLFDELELDDKTTDAFQVWNAWILASSGEHVAQGAHAKLVLQPTRKTFVEFACFLGHVLPELRSVYWAHDIATWSELDFFDTRVSPLSYASPDPTMGYTAEYPMDAKNKTGLGQHVAQVATRSLVETSLGAGIDPIIAGGLANMLVIDLFGEVNTKVDGDRRANTTTGRSRFIPASQGGKSSGGSLPPVSAESRWRADHGKEYFLRQLRFAQKAGSKKADHKADKERTFLLVADGGDGTRPLAAPLLHASVADKRIDAAFFGDYAELVRAYRVGFLHWLRDESSRDSGEKFVQFLATLAAAERDDAEPFSKALAVVYEVPLSQEIPSEDDLEGRFLHWLAK